MNECSGIQANLIWILQRIPVNNYQMRCPSGWGTRAQQMTGSTAARHFNKKGGKESPRLVTNMFLSTKLTFRVKGKSWGRIDLDVLSSRYVFVSRWCRHTWLLHDCLGNCSVEQHHLELPWVCEVTDLIRKAILYSTVLPLPLFFFCTPTLPFLPQCLRKYPFPWGRAAYNQMSLGSHGGGGGRWKSRTK